jgi:hypothetical protein
MHILARLLLVVAVTLGTVAVVAGAADAAPETVEAVTAPDGSGGLIALVRCTYTRPAGMLLTKATYAGAFDLAVCEYIAGGPHVWLGCRHYVPKSLVPFNANCFQFTT